MRRWLPDAPPTSPDVYLGMNGMYPTSDGGYAVIPCATDGSGLLAGALTQSSNPYGGFVRYMDGTVKLIWNVANAGNKVYENSTDVTGTAATMRSVAMYGNVCIITQGRSLNVKAKTGTGGTFADLAGTPPKADYIVSNNLAVMLLSYNDGTDYQDGWWASDIGDHTTWTPASTNQAANGKLKDTPGPITGGILFKGDVYAFKESGVYGGSYVGRPVIWQWRCIRTDIGVPNQECILTDGDYLYIFGRQGAFRFDGANFQRIDDGVWGGNNSGGISDYGIGPLVHTAAAASGKFFGLYDSVTSCCVWYAYTGLTGYGWAYNTKTGAWGNLAEKFGVTSVRPYGVPWPMSRDLLISSGTSAVGGYGDPSWVVFGSDAALYSMKTINSSATVKVSASVTTGLIGSYQGMTEVKRVIPVLVNDRAASTDTTDAVDATFTLTPYTASSSIVAPTAGSTVSSSTAMKRFDYVRSDRFHCFKISNATHDWKILDVIVESKPAGTD